MNQPAIYTPRNGRPRRCTIIGTHPDHPDTYTIRLRSPTGEGAHLYNVPAEALKLDDVSAPAPAPAPIVADLRTMPTYRADWWRDQLKQTAAALNSAAVLVAHVHQRYTPPHPDLAPTCKEIHSAAALLRQLARELAPPDDAPQHQAGEQLPPICPNCQQWQQPRTDGPSQDCFNECRRRGMVE